MTGQSFRRNPDGSLSPAEQYRARGVHPYLDAFLLGVCFTAGILTAAGTGLTVALFLLNQGVIS